MPSNGCFVCERKRCQSQPFIILSTYDTFNSIGYAINKRDERYIKRYMCVCAIDRHWIMRMSCIKTSLEGGNFTTISF